ncbi:MAG TPA: abortive infection system antitoxin AbiGi family protein, partial [Sulfuricurvum sp.]|nr:abortive infection system antitoxin AbiGi family protein [Sulfuricurvum sp.]
EFAAPMVSFCDIPLSQVKNHITKYGAYGIGLTKKWAEKQKLNPVFYIEKHSSLAQRYLNIYMEYIINSNKFIYNMDEKEKSIVDILRYMKNYQDDLTRGGNIYKDYRFSDEREWRYVLDYNNDIPFIYALDEHYNKENANKDIDKYRLKFEPNDIKYVIIQNENEIPEFLELFKTTKGKNYSYHDVERLMTRIITTEQIVEDF